MTTRVVITLTQSEWNDCVSAMKEIVEETQKNTSSEPSTLTNIYKINKNIFSKSSNVKTINVNNNTGNDVITDEEFDSIMNEIKQENDTNVRVLLTFLFVSFLSLLFFTFFVCFVFGSNEHQEG